MKFWDYKNADYEKIGSMSQLAGIRRYEFAEGKAKGIETAEIHTGSGLQLTVLPGRGMDIAWTNYRGIPLSYMSKTGIVSPAYYESNGMNWLHGFFAGALTTCGLLNAGGPEKVNHPVIGEREYGLHGRISNCAAEQVSVYEDFEDGEYVMKISGLMKEGILHGESLEMRREISTAYGSNEFKIRDTITNHAVVEQDIMLLYHINFGYPLMDSGSRIVVNSKEIIPQSETAAKAMDRALVCDEPTLGIEEMAYSHDFNTDENGDVKVALINDKLELGVAIEYNKEQLPCFSQWKMMNKKEYVLGLEPGTALPVGYNKAKENGMIKVLQPEERMTVEITYKILDGEECIKKYEAMIYGRYENE
ncbi:MAG: aldose 1-epimerase family protein [Clostridia bacterium]|nr:aldose 1-epimerase family protein [Clostridia bacterium]